MTLKQGIYDNSVTCWPSRRLMEEGAADGDNFQPTLKRSD